MRPLLLAALACLAVAPALPSAVRAEPGAQAAFFCYWVDGPRKQAATTALFRAEIAQADDIASAFATEMRKDAKRSRVYDCGWRRDPVQAEQDRQSLRAAHRQKGYTVSDVNWDPRIAER